MDITKKSVIRLIVLVVLLFNAGLSMAGINPIPVTEADITGIIDGLWNVASLIAALATAVWSWWKDAPLTQAGKAGHDLTVQIKEDGYYHGDIIESEN